jgi:hypothetical protein
LPSSRPALPDSPINLLGRPLAAAALIFTASILLYLINLGRAPHPDELYHVLAARGLLEHGEPRIAEGLYTRVLGYTWLIAQTFGLFGESLAAARLPSILFMAALNALLFLWLRREAGNAAAWLGAGLFASSPFALEIAQFARFYALQSLAFFAGCILVHDLVRRLPTVGPAMVAGGLGAAFCFALAVYLQPTTLIGLVGVGLWLGSILILPRLLDPALDRRHRLRLLALGLAVAVAIGVVMLATGVLAELWQRYRSTPVFLAPRANEFWFYHLFYVLYYPTLWPLIGFLGFAALARWPRPAWFAVVIFVTGFLLNSFAGPKNLRYFAYAQPFLFVVFGLGLAAILPWLSQAGRAFTQQLRTHLAGLGLARWRLPRLALWGALLILLLANAALLRTATLLADITVPPQNPDVRWDETRPLVEPLLAEVDAVVTMVELETLYFWERYDVLFSPSRLGEIANAGEFAADFRTGRPVISTRDSLARLVDCTASGMFIAVASRWRQSQFVDAETVSFIEGTMTRLELPGRSQLLVFTWQHTPPGEGDPACPPIHELLRQVDH